MKKIFASITLIVVAVALAASMALPSQTVAASADQQQVVRTPISQVANQQMFNSLQRERNWLMRQNLHLNQATQIAQKAQEAISKAQQAGLDVTELQNALNTFNSQVSAAQSSYDQAAAILAAPAGFDANGNVIDSQVAH
jgi:predicted  nucleic acid-binding Zn-ribbon protein